MINDLARALGDSMFYWVGLLVASPSQGRRRLRMGILQWWGGAWPAKCGWHCAMDDAMGSKGTKRAA